MGDVFAGGWGWWIIGLAVGVPALLVVLTELIGALTRRGNPVAKPLRMLRNWVIPVGALFALLVFAIQSPADQVWTRVVATVFGFLVILLVLSAFNVALFANAKPGSWRERIPSIFVEIGRLVLVGVGLALLFSWVWDADVGGLFTALGVGSIVIGLALQNAVGGVISGLLLLFEQPFKIGDWLDAAGVKGRVVEVNWRAVHIDTGAGIQIVPNSSLSGASFTNLSEPEGPYSAETAVKFSTDDPPHEVIALLIEVADSLPMRLQRERASVDYSGAGAYAVSIPVAGPADASRALSMYLSWLWYAARRRGFALDGDSTDPLAEPQRLVEAMHEIAPTLHLREEDFEEILPAARLERYGVGEIVLPSGVVPDEVRVVLSGRAVLALDVHDGRVDFASAEKGDLIGQTALTRERTQAVTVAGEILTVVVLPLATIDTLIRTRPRLAAEIGESLELKRTLAASRLAELGIARGIITGR
ncbi:MULTISPECIES: mechanosensitive ion channel domain-containing protein [unclassified Microbacterium]|uniref:mechanosensitive ion channel domain-containing protein n=1 Tax=unclassified Microbacterium TaxID=2609290 RepID=UPI0016051E1A|nr:MULTISPECIES: mechanosensitive ion channel domain-containing protein [unclassified Microbacterium]QNA91298.1 mechanosensitive ion channel [Microbacterium sp. Se63.02b]QYM64449.1 mechanosensitive ion channel [Microbacterium sp. Se5.02b]